MLKKDTSLLEEAYLKIRKAPYSLSQEKEKVSPYPNKIVSASPLDEPAPGVDMDMVSDEEINGDEEEDFSTPEEESDTTGVPVEMHSEPSMTISTTDHECSCHSEEDEEDEMAIDNLHSVNESLVKIACFISSGGHLEAWQQQKLAICMDNLTSIARSLRSGLKC